MIVVRLAGGLGNQLFQLAAAIELGNRLQMPFAFYTGDLARYATTRSPMLQQVLKEDYQIIEPAFIARLVVRYRINKIAPFIFPWYVHSGNIMQVKGRKWYMLDDYFQDTSTISSGITEVIKLLQERQKDVSNIHDAYNNICNGAFPNELVAIHVRRGDFLKPENARLYPLLTLDYYKTAISRLQLAPKKIVVFCESPIFDSASFSGIEVIQVHNYGLSDFEEFLLFSLFQNKVIANSTFSFWSAIINHQHATTFAASHWAHRHWENALWHKNLNNFTFNTI